MSLNRTTGQTPCRHSTGQETGITRKTRFPLRIEKVFAAALRKGKRRHGSLRRQPTQTGSAS